MTSTQKFFFWLILATGLLFRLFNLGHASYQIDEINVVQFALQEKGLFTAYGTELDRFLLIHRLPLLMILLRASLQALGATVSAVPSEFVARLPFALIGVASLPLFFALGRRLAGAKAGLLAMALAALSPFHIFYSREAYDYSMLICFSAGVLWAGLGFWDAVSTRKTFPMRWAIYYNVFAVLLLYAHLSGLVFLATWCMILGVLLLLNPATRAFNKVVPTVAALGLPYFLFAPFLLKLLGGGWVDSDAGAAVRRISASIVPDLLGRMGWGQAWWALLPFVAALAAGVVVMLRAKTEGRTEGRVLLLHLLIAFLLQAWLLRVARFEIRYFATILPVLLVTAGIGLAAVCGWLSARIPKVGGWLGGLLLLALFGWLGANAWLVTQMESRGANFKGLAKWVNDNLPENGIYCFWNGYELRGVPSFYPTPGRFATFPITWSSAEDYRRLQVQERMVSLFQRFPTMAYTEYSPSDVLAPKVPYNKPVPRSELFMRQVWITDAAYDKLVQWKTFPMGNTQWNNEIMDRVLISYNLPEDLPELARKRGRSLYHYFGNDWRFAKDQQMNDWLVSTGSATVYLGNTEDHNVTGRLRILAMGAPHGGRLNVYGFGRKLTENVDVPSRPGEIVIDQVRLPPGETRLFLEILPPPGELESSLFLHGISIEPVSASIPASSP